MTPQGRSELQAVIEELGLFRWAMDKPHRDEFRETLRRLSALLTAVEVRQVQEEAEAHHPNCDISFASCTCDKEREMEARRGD